MKQPDFGVQLSDVAVEAPQASPCHQHKAWTKRTDDHQCNGNAGPFDQERGNERAHSNGEGEQALEQAKYASEDVIGGQSGHQREQADIDERVTDSNACQQSEGSCFRWKQRNKRDGQIPIRQHQFQTIQQAAAIPLTGMQ